MSVNLNFHDFIGQPKTLQEWLTECSTKRGLGLWLLIRDTDADCKVDASTEIFPVTGDTGDLTDDEFEWFDSAIHDNGFSSFLNLDQIEDVIDNLTMQNSKYTDQELLHAVNFYFERDAFVEIGNT